MFRDVLYALRTFRRAPLAVFTIVTTVAVGLGLVAVVFTFFNIFLFRVDEVRNPGELFAVERPRTGGGERVRFTRPQYEALQRETAVFTDAFAMLADLDSRIDGWMMAGTLVTGNFFQVLGVSASLGRALTPDDDHRASGRPVLVLSHRGWSRLYATDPDVLDRTLLVNGLPFGVVGVMPEGFLLPGRTFAVVGVTRDVAGFRLADFEEAGVYVPTSAAAAETSLTVRVHGDPELARRALLERLTAIDPNMGQVMTMRTVARLETYLLQIAFWLTMVLGGLALALTLSGLFGVLSYLVEQRTKEIGVCLALGATSRGCASDGESFDTVDHGSSWLSSLIALRADIASGRDLAEAEATEECVSALFAGGLFI